jgi:hypothetical protein
MFAILTAIVKYARFIMENELKMVELKERIRELEGGGK